MTRAVGAPDEVRRDGARRILVNAVNAAGRDYKATRQDGGVDQCREAAADGCGCPVEADSYGACIQAEGRPDHRARHPGYMGYYAVTRDQRGASVSGPADFAGQRAALSLMVYPQPLGSQVEYNRGTGPRFNPLTKRIELSGRQGGYPQTM